MTVPAIANCYLNPDAETKGQDQREDEDPAGAHSTLQQSKHMWIWNSALVSHLFGDLISYSFLRRIEFFLQTDKASMLDEAIEYLKSLQLQLQVSTYYPVKMFVIAQERDLDV